MFNFSLHLLSVFLTITSCAAFVPNMNARAQAFSRNIPLASEVLTNEVETAAISSDSLGCDGMEITQSADKEIKPKMKKNNPSHQQGLFSPIVLLAKDLMGDDELTKLRAKVISIHSDIISSFVNTYETAYGNLALRVLYSIADKNKDGSLDENELKSALHNLGFSWIQEKQLKGIIKRADVDGNNVIDFKEFCEEVPRTLRTNLIKLAKKNGGEMGLLA